MNVDIRSIVDKTAQFVARNGQEFERKILGNEKDNVKFSFLKPSDPYHAYYRLRVKDFQEGDAKPADATKPKDAQVEIAIATRKSTHIVTIVVAIVLTRGLTDQSVHSIIVKRKEFFFWFLRVCGRLKPRKKRKSSSNRVSRSQMTICLQLRSHKACQLLIWT